MGYKTWDKKDIICYRCQEKGHYSKECMSEKPVYQRKSDKREASYIGVYTNSEEEEEEIEEVEEEEVYALPRNKPYTTNRKTAQQLEAERKQQSESRRELNLRSRKPVDEFMEVETPQIITSTPKRKVKRGPSQIDQMPPYNVM